jgi:DNA-binding SARP family transcriptional activator
MGTKGSDAMTADGNTGDDSAAPALRLPAVPALRLRLLGAPAWRAGEAAWQPLSRKDAALLARLALEGRSARTTIAAWLWPQVPLPRAHANLRQRLYKLRHGAAQALVDEAGDGLALAAGVDSDVRAERCAPDAAFDAMLLDGLEPATDAVQDWIDEARRQWQARRVDLMSGQATRHEAAGELAAALALTERLLLIEPLLEHAWRRLMRLHALRGDRAAALAAFERCERMLRDELGVRPAPETVSLMEAVESGACLPSTRAGTPGVLPARPPLMVGRDATLAVLRGRLGGDGAPARPLTVVHGWPGVGKSTLLAALAHDPAVARQFPDGVFWASLGEAPDLAAELGTWAQAIGVAAGAGAPRIEALTAELTARLRDKRVLLLVDDVWRLEHARAFAIGGHGAVTLMSTRLPDVAIALAPAAEDVHRLGVLDETAGLDLLRALTPGTVAAHPEAARALVADLEGLPLALHVAGRLLETESRLGWGVADLLQELRQGAALLAAPAPHDMGGARHAASPTVQALLQRSTDALEPALREHFALLGLFVPKPATFDLAAMSAAWGLADPKPLVRRLVSHGLLEPLPDARFQMHALLVVHARALLEAGVEPAVGAGTSA